MDRIPPLPQAKMYEKPTQISSTEEFILNLQVQKLRLALPIGPK